MSETERVEEVSGSEPVEGDPGSPTIDNVPQGDPGPPEMEYFEKGEKAPNG